MRSLPVLWRWVKQKPQGVRIERHDGTVDHPGLVYEGLIDDTHQWRVLAEMHAHDELVIDVMPGHTALVVAARPDQEG